jgi:hypothetical protein
MEIINLKEVLNSFSESTEKQLAEFGNNFVKAIFIREDSGPHIASDADCVAMVMNGEIVVKGENNDIKNISEGEMAVIKGGYRIAATVSSIIIIFQEKKKESIKFSKGLKKVGAGRFKKSKKEICADESSDVVEGKESAKNFAEHNLPKIRDAWLNVAGPVTYEIIRDEERFKELARLTYGVLPIPIRALIREDIFVEWCFNNRHRIAVNKEAEVSADSNEPPAL